MESWNLGPDTVIPSESFICSKLNESVKLRIGSIFEPKPSSLYTKLKTTVRKFPKTDALVFEVTGKWERLNYSQYWSLCLSAAKSFIKLNLGVSEVVGIIGFNAPQWLISLFGSIFAGGVGCGLYATNSFEVCEHIIKDSGARIMVVENQVQLDKILKCKEKCQIDCIIQYTGKVKNSFNGLVLSWDEFLECGQSVNEDQLQERIKTIAPNKCATLIYTSGTTGMPKAAMLSHDNIIALVKYGCEMISLNEGNERFVSYLPLSHSAAQFFDCYLTITYGLTLYFARPDAFKGSLINTFTYAKPTFIACVPRIWEKMYESITKKIEELSDTKKKLFQWATNIGFLHIQSKFKNENNYQVKYWLANKLVLRKIREQIGLDECRNVYSGAAPINSNVLKFFMGLGLPICEGYGMSETSGPHIFGLNYRNRLTSVGYHQNNYNILTKIVNKDEKGNGEVCMYGRNVFMGYLNDLNKTRDTVDADGFVYSGDIGKIDDDGFLYITGRLKEIIITSGGENIPPIQIEDTIKSELPQCISNCMLIGDKRKYLTILITLKSQIDLDTLEPLDELADDCKKHIQNLGSKCNRVSEILLDKNDPIYGEIESAINRANSKTISQATKVQKFKILPKDFSLPGGELGPTYKIRRIFITQKYTKVIHEMYSEGNFKKNVSFNLD